jgi:nucleoid-associated protein YgaU
MKLEDGDAESILSNKPEQSKVEYIAEHTMRPDETLSHLALKYYGSAIREKWMVIYEANKDVIGPDPAHVRPGTVLKIPKLPKE